MSRTGPSTEHDGAGPGLVGALLSPLTLPRRAVGKIEDIAEAVLSLAETTERSLGSIDRRAGELVTGLGALRTALVRIEGQVQTLMGLEATIDDHMEAVRRDLNARLLAVEQQVLQIHPPLTQMATDVKKIEQLLPDPSDGPFSRLRDTLTSS